MYIVEANKQLNDKRNYKLVKTDPFHQLIIKLNTNVQKYFADKVIDYATFKFLFIDKPIRRPSL